MDHKTRMDLFACPMRAVFFFVLAFLSVALLSCSKSVKESAYASRIIGAWETKEGKESESITFREDGTFFAYTHEGSSLFKEFARGHSGILEGFWAIHGKSLFFTLEEEVNFNASSNERKHKIVSFKDFEFVLEDKEGNKQFFYRLR